MRVKSASRARGALFLALLSAGLLCAACGPGGSGASALVLRIETQDKGTVLFRSAVRGGDILEFTWIHSVEHFPWTERFEIREDGTLLLREIRFRGYGAGVPNERGRSVRLEDGWIVHEGIDEIFPAYRWINSWTAVDTLALNGTSLIRGSDLPHHEPLELRIERGR